MITPLTVVAICGAVISVWAAIVTVRSNRRTRREIAKLVAKGWNDERH